MAKTEIYQYHLRHSNQEVLTESVSLKPRKGSQFLSPSGGQQKLTQRPALTIRHIQLIRQADGTILRADNGQKMPVTPQGEIDWQKYIHEKCLRLVQ